jgi:hypothetical protein
VKARFRRGCGARGWFPGPLSCRLLCGLASSAVRCVPICRCGPRRQLGAGSSFAGASTPPRQLCRQEPDRWPGAVPSAGRPSLRALAGPLVLQRSAVARQYLFASYSLAAPLAGSPLSEFGFAGILMLRLEWWKATSPMSYGRVAAARRCRPSASGGGRAGWHRRVGDVGGRACWRFKGRYTAKSTVTQPGSCPPRRCRTQRGRHRTGWSTWWPRLHRPRAGRLRDRPRPARRHSR